MAFYGYFTCYAFVEYSLVLLYSDTVKAFFCLFISEYTEHVLFIAS